MRGKIDNVELFMILHNKTLEDIATIKPKTKEELISIKGISDKKFDKYGEVILKIVENNQENSK